VCLSKIVLGLLVLRKRDLYRLAVDINIHGYIHGYYAGYLLIKPTTHMSYLFVSL